MDVLTFVTLRMLALIIITILDTYSNARYCQIQTKTQQKIGKSPNLKEKNRTRETEKRQVHFAT